MSSLLCRWEQEKNQSISTIRWKTQIELYLDRASSLCLVSWRQRFELCMIISGWTHSFKELNKNIRAVLLCVACSSAVDKCWETNDIQSIRLGIGLRNIRDDSMHTFELDIRSCRLSSHPSLFFVPQLFSYCIALNMIPP
jgi:hypothetical protein